MRHCWHDTGVCKMVNPAQYKDVCCFCDKKRWRVETPVNHGKFFPRRNVLRGKVENSRPFEDEECSIRSEVSQLLEQEMKV